MDVTRYRVASDFAAGTFTNTAVDSTTNVDSVTQNVALSPYIQITGTSANDGNVLAGGSYTKNGGNAWATFGPWYVTAQANDSVTITIGAGVVGIVVQCSGILTPHPRLYPGTGLFPAAIRNGAIATILHNGTQIASLDCYNSTPSTPQLLVSSGDTIQIIHSGRHNAGYTPVGSTMIAVQAFTLLSGSGGTSGAYTSPVIDAQQSDTAWVQAEMEASVMTGGSPNASFSFSTGNTPTPDGTWKTVTQSLADLVRTDGSRVGLNTVPLAAIARGRYAQWTMTFPTGLTYTPWLRNLAIYWWVPERDPDILSHFTPVTAAPWTPDPALHAVLAAQAVRLTKTREAVRDLNAGYAINGAGGELLAAQAADLGLVVYTGEPPASARARVQAALQSRAQAGSPFVLAQAIGRLVSGQAATVSTSWSSGKQTATATNTAMTTGPVVVAQTAPWALSVTIPPPVGAAYPGLPGATIAYAKTVITSFIASAVLPGFYVGSAGTITPTFQ